MNKPRISVAVPTHKRADYLKDCLTSIFNQTLLPVEVVISEDGSDVDTKKVIDQFICTYPDIIVKHIVNEIPLGQLANRQQAFRLTTGEYVAMLDDDDIWHNDFLNLTYNALSKHEESSFCSSNHYFMDGNNNLLEEKSLMFADYCGRSNMDSGEYDDVFMRTLTNKACIFTIHVTLFKRKILEEIGFFRNYGGMVPDYTLMLSLGALNHKVYFLTNYLGYCRIHEGQQTAKRLENTISKVEAIHCLYNDYKKLLSKSQIKKLRKKYIEVVLECSIAYAHHKRRKESLTNMLNIYELGFGRISLYRALVLMVLLGGVSKKTL